jgi:hypothetical protein
MRNELKRNQGKISVLLSLFLAVFLLAVNFNLLVFEQSQASQHDGSIGNDTGANVRTDINNALGALWTNHAGTSAPTTTYGHQIWLDTSAATNYLKLRNGGNTSWITLGCASCTNLGHLDAINGGNVSGAVTWSNTDYIKLPVGTVAQRPGSPAAGQIRYNSDNSNFEGYHASQWTAFGREFSSPDLLNNIEILPTVAANALTVALKTDAASNAAAGDPIITAFRSSTLASGDLTTVKVTGALSVVISSGSTLGHASALEYPIYVYLINNAGTAELAVSTYFFDESDRVTTVAEGGAGAADSNQVMYSTTARSNVAFRMIGKLLSTQTTAGTWAAAPTRVTVGGAGKFAQSAGIYKFPANAVSSTDTNTLDAYQESASCTPVINGLSTSGTASYTTQVCDVTKIGKKVFADIYLNWTSATGTGNMVVAGLPYLASNLTNYRTACSIGYADGISSTSDLGAIIGQNTNYISLYQIPVSGTTSAVAVDPSGLIMMSCEYTSKD